MCVLHSPVLVHPRQRPSVQTPTQPDPPSRRRSNGWGERHPAHQARCRFKQVPCDLCPDVGIYQTVEGADPFSINRNVFLLNLHHRNIWRRNWLRSQGMLGWPDRPNNQDYQDEASHSGNKAFVGQKCAVFTSEIPKDAWRCEPLQIIKCQCVLTETRAHYEEVVGSQHVCVVIRIKPEIRIGSYWTKVSTNTKVLVEHCH
jgi:hypothetical protein